MNTCERKSVVTGKRKCLPSFLLMILFISLCCITAWGQSEPVNFPKIGQAADSARTHLFPKAVGDSLPRPIGFVNDFEDLFTAREEQELDSTLQAFGRPKDIVIVIVTIPVSMTTGDRFDSFTLRLANQWGAGERSKNTAILIGISRGWRRMRIQNSYGMAKKITDRETQQIIDMAFLPLFRKDRYYEGTRQGLNGLMKHFK